MQKDFHNHRSNHFGFYGEFSFPIPSTHRVDPQIPQDVAYVLHYACICAGIRAGSRAISRSSDNEIRNSLKLLRTYSWIDSDLRNLFEGTLTSLD